MAKEDKIKALEAAISNIELIWKGSDYEAWRSVSFS